MKIRVKLHGVFRIGRFKDELRDYPAGTRVADVVRELGFSEHLLGTVIVNEVHVSVEQELHDGDCLMILPLLDGG
ncbi:MoaD/ThiS family protein [Geoalkalibacter sp.]|uniref:MoaD/ThiS family protein n=1 Tax=Geoalkalibacter sp. TaxID=3041440 RepID=UPI00272E5646|nr:MoaD/ThiS family protein [Geoalkalibacter sp.]